MDALKVLMSRNWGDAIAPFLFGGLSGRKPRILPMDREAGEPHYLTVGSALRMCDEQSIVWGTGFLTETGSLGLLSWSEAHNECRRAPRAIHAVRGPLTRDKLRTMGVDCPAVYGDPALVMPLLYQPDYKARFRLGIIPHYRTRDWRTIARLAADSRVRILDITHNRIEKRLPGTRKHLRLIDQMLQCDRIVSESLHGIILADAYGIPAHHARIIDFTDFQAFKYADYELSVGREPGTVIQLDAETTLEAVLRQFPRYRLRLPTEALLGACPFLSPSFHPARGAAVTDEPKAP